MSDVAAAQPYREGSTLPVAEIDIQSGRIIQASESYCGILEKPPETVIGAPASRYLMDDDTCIDWHFFSSVVMEPAVSITTTRRFTRTDGTEKKIRSTYRTYRLSRGESCLFSFLDVPDTGHHAIHARDETASIARTAREAYIQSMVAVVQFRDLETSAHLKRTRLYVQRLLEILDDRFPLSRYGRTLVAKLSMLHDIGKTGIDDSILFKTGQFSADEFERMKLHTTYGARILQEALACTQYDIALMYARDIVEFHHERWDGTGYPHRLKETAIPFIARVMAVADVYDALRSTRRYKPAYGHEDAVRIMSDSAGTQFDPEIIAVFLRYHDDFRLIETLDADAIPPGIDRTQYR